MKLTGVVLGLAIVILGIVGWVANVVQIVATINHPITGLFILKCVGVLVAPLGVVLGWVGIL
jgi:hypothetical protein